MKINRNIKIISEENQDFYMKDKQLKSKYSDIIEDIKKKNRNFSSLIIDKNIGIKNNKNKFEEFILNNNIHFFRKNFLDNLKTFSKIKILNLFIFNLIDNLKVIPNNNFS